LPCIWLIQVLCDLNFVIVAAGFVILAPPSVITKCVITITEAVICCGMA